MALPPQRRTLWRNRAGYGSRARKRDCGSPHEGRSAAPRWRLRCAVDRPSVEPGTSCSARREVILSSARRPGGPRPAKARLHGGGRRDAHRRPSGRARRAYRKRCGEERVLWAAVRCAAGVSRPSPHHASMVAASAILRDQVLGERPATATPVAATSMAVRRRRG